MGSRVETRETPHFRVRAAGALRQLPGCPQRSVSALGPERLEALCRGECYNPSDERKRITRIEIVRIRPQRERDEPLDSLIDDPWRVFPCAGDSEGCVAEFEDPEFGSARRDALYCARAIEEASPTVNGAQLRCQRDEAGACVKVEPCYGDPRTPYQDDCLAPAEGRAWSSPICVDFAGS